VINADTAVLQSDRTTNFHFLRNISKIREEDLFWLMIRKF
jgi:hypothetical protein